MTTHELPGSAATFEVTGLSPGRAFELFIQPQRDEHLGAPGTLRVRTRTCHPPGVGAARGQHGGGSERGRGDRDGEGGGTVMGVGTAMGTAWTSGVCVSPWARLSAFVPVVCVSPRVRVSPRACLSPWVRMSPGPVCPHTSWSFPMCPSIAWV